jgi:hypothetical protein
METFTFACSNCGQHLSVLPEAVGSTGPCPKCGSPQVVPGPPVEPPTPRAPGLKSKQRVTYQYYDNEERLVLWIAFAFVIFLNYVGYRYRNSPDIFLFRAISFATLIGLLLTFARKYVCIDRKSCRVTSGYRLFGFIPLGRVKTFAFSELANVYWNGPPYLIMMLKESTEGGGDSIPIFIGFRTVDGGNIQITYVPSGRKNAHANVRRIAGEIAEMTGLPLFEEVGLAGTVFVCERKKLEASLQAMRLQLLDVLDQLASDDGSVVPQVSGACADNEVYRVFESKLVAAIAKPLAARREAVSNLLTVVERAIKGN